MMTLNQARDIVISRLEAVEVLDTRTIEAMSHLSNADLDVELEATDENGHENSLSLCIWCLEYCVGDENAGPCKGLD